MDFIEKLFHIIYFLQCSTMDVQNLAQVFLSAAGVVSVSCVLCFINWKGFKTIEVLLEAPFVWEEDPEDVEGEYDCLKDEAPDDLLFDEDDESRQLFDKSAKKRKVIEKLKPELPNYFI